MRLGYRDLVIALFAIGIILGLAFGTGTIYGRSTAPTPTPSVGGGGTLLSAGGGAAAGGGGGAGGGAGGAGAAAGPFAGQTLGTITGVQGGTFTVRELNGTTTTLAEDVNTQYNVSAPGSASSLQPGQLVLVNPGPPNAQGVTIAEAVLVLPASLAANLPASGAGPAGGASARPSGSPTGGAQGGGPPPAAP